MVPTWFLYISGFSLLLLGIMQIQARPRKKDANFYERFINLGTFWSLLCMAVGTAIVIMALGYWTPFDQPPAKPPGKHRPSGR
jgi:putative copper export protein